MLKKKRYDSDPQNVSPLANGEQANSSILSLVVDISLKRNRAAGENQKVPSEHERGLTGRAVVPLRVPVCKFSEKTREHQIGVASVPSTPQAS